MPGQPNQSPGRKYPNHTTRRLDKGPTQPQADRVLESTPGFALFRILFFLLLAIDKFSQIRSAGKYGLNSFNVPHFPFIQLLPTTEVMVFVDLVITFLALRIGFNVATRLDSVLLAALWNGAYFVSQIDGYQHHYLLGLLLVLFCFHSWDLPQPLVFRAMQLQLVLVYFWTVVAKLDSEWIYGQLLPSMVGPTFTRNLALVANATSLPTTTFYAGMAQSTVLVESLAALLLLLRQGWAAAVLAVPMHIMMGASGLQIGYFSFYMVLFYLPELPQSWLQRVEGLLTPPRAPALLLAAVVLGTAVTAAYFPFPVVYPGEPSQLGPSVFYSTLATLTLLPYLVLRPRVTGNRVTRELLCYLGLFLCHLGSGTFREYSVLAAHSRAALGQVEAGMRYYAQALNHAEWAEGWADYALLARLAKQRDKATAANKRAFAMDRRELKAIVGVAGELMQGEKAQAACQLLPSMEEIATTEATQFCNSPACEDRKKYADGYVLRKFVPALKKICP